MITQCKLYSKIWFWVILRKFFKKLSDFSRVCCFANLFSILVDNDLLKILVLKSSNLEVIEWSLSYTIKASPACNPSVWDITWYQRINWQPAEILWYSNLCKIFGWRVYIKCLGAPICECLNVSFYWAMPYKIKINRILEN